jgi:hypothetical protein
LGAQTQFASDFVGSLSAMPGCSTINLDLAIQHFS